MGRFLTGEVTPGYAFQEKQYSFHIPTVMLPTHEKLNPSVKTPQKAFAPHR